MSDLRFDPDYRSHPGDTLGAYLEDWNLDVPTLARKIEYPQPELNAILAGDRPVTVDLAYRMMKTLGGPSVGFWIDRQSTYDLFQAEKWGAISTEMRFCSECHHLILEEDSPVESILGGAWKHFTCWYDGPMPPRRYQR